MKADNKDWQEMGNEIKDIRARLISFTCNPKYQKLVTKKELDTLRQALSYVDKFRDKAEDTMLVNSCGNEDHTHIFYGNNDGKVNN